MAPVKAKEQHTKKMLKMINGVAVAPWTLLRKTSLKRTKVTVGDRVRIKGISTTFKKGSKQKNSNEVFKVTSVAQPKSTSSDPVSYRFKVPGVTKFRVGFKIKK